jgi:hypothetical protein
MKTKCSYCNSEIVRLPSQIKRNKGKVFCNKVCQKNYNRQEIEDVRCAACRKLLKRPPSSYKYENSFCNKYCESRFRRNHNNGCLFRGGNPGSKEIRRRGSWY